jgi:hypothetical protein
MFLQMYFEVYRHCQRSQMMMLAVNGLLQIMQLDSVVVMFFLLSIKGSEQ